MITNLPVHYLVKHETVLPSQKIDFHFVSADFGNDQFTICIIDKGENIQIKPLNTFSFEAVKSFQSQWEKQIKKY